MTPLSALHPEHSALMMAILMLRACTYLCQGKAPTSETESRCPYFEACDNRGNCHSPQVCCWSVYNSLLLHMTWRVGVGYNAYSNDPPFSFAVCAMKVPTKALNQCLPDHCKLADIGITCKIFCLVSDHRGIQAAVKVTASYLDQMHLQHTSHA